MSVVKQRLEGAEKTFAARTVHKNVSLVPEGSIGLYSFGLISSVLTALALIMVNQKLSPDCVSLKVSPLFPVPLSL